MVYREKRDAKLEEASQKKKLMVRRQKRVKKRTRPKKSLIERRDSGRGRGRRLNKNIGETEGMAKIHTSENQNEEKRRGGWKEGN